MARMDARPLEDFTMWAMLQDMGQCFEPDVLEDLVRQWIQMATQKTAGQRKEKKSDLSWDNLERLKMGILGEAVALVLSGKLEIIKGEKKNGPNRQI